ncbi:hypothetical protein MRX96_018635 [Rhipicephalus microplus]
MVLPTRSQWPFLRRLDFLRQHIRPKRQIRFSNYIKITRSIGAVSQGEEADSVNNNESTSNDVLARGFTCQDAAVEDVSAEGCWDSPVDFEIYVSLVPSDAETKQVLHHLRPPNSEQFAAVGQPRRKASISKPPKSERRKSGLRRCGADSIRSNTRGRQKRGRSASKMISRGERGKAPPVASLTAWTKGRQRGLPPKGLQLLRRWRSPAEGSSSSDEEEEDEGEGVGKYEVEVKQCDSEEFKQERQEAAIEVALFLTTVASKVASSSTAIGEPPSVKSELRVDAGDSDTLFLLGLRGLMSKLDAKSNSRAQIDILKVLHDRISDAESRRPVSCDEVDEQVKQKQTADDSVRRLVQARHAGEEHTRDTM